MKDWLDELTPPQLDDVAHLLLRRAEEKRRGEWKTEDTVTTEVDQSQSLDIHEDPLPERVPAKATLTQKTINDNDY